LSNASAISRTASAISAIYILSVMAFTSIGDVGHERGGPLKPFLVLFDRGEPEHGPCRDGLRRRLPGPQHLIVIVADRNARQPQNIHHGR
jgi:hypothetical protein